MFDQIKGMNLTELGWAVNVGMPYDISNLQLAETHAGGKNLNTYSYDLAFTMLADVLKKGFKVKRIICDAVGPEKLHKHALYSHVKHYLDGKTEVICCSKADDIYPVVSAASICAKVTRD